jgi:hypothetical protein
MKHLACTIIAITLMLMVTSSSAAQPRPDNEFNTAVMQGYGTETVFNGINLYIGSLKHGTNSIESYDLDYYLTGSASYSPELAKLAMALSISVYDPAHMTESFENHGFDSIINRNHGMLFETGLINNQPTFAIAQKDNIIAVVIRGTDTVSNWLTNISVGFGEIHEGFAESKDYIMRELMSLYCTEDEETVFFITGFSQGAAIANLLAAELSDEYSQEQVFAYTFATPNVTREVRENIYENIFNICNTFDLVTVMPTHVTGNEWWKYGRDINFRREFLFTSFIPHHEQIYFAFASQLAIPDEEGNVGDIFGEKSSTDIQTWDKRLRRIKWK